MDSNQRRSTPTRYLRHGAATVGYAVSHEFPERSMHRGVVLASQEHRRAPGGRNCAEGLRPRHWSSLVESCSGRPGDATRG